MEERIDKIHSVLDLGFSDYFKGENVRETTLRSKLEMIEEAVALLLVDEAINFSLKQALGDERPSPEIYRLDFPSDLRASFYLLLGGYYRQAILCLRNWLEMRLFGIYFGFVEQDHSKYEDWKLGKLDENERLFGRSLIDKLFARAEFQKADKRFKLRDRLKSLYKKLSAFIHGAGAEKYDLQRDTDSVPGYNRASVDLWFKLLKDAFGEVVFCLFVAYGHDIFRGIRPEEVKTMLAPMPSEYEQELRSALRKSRNLNSVRPPASGCSSDK